MLDRQGYRKYLDPVTLAKIRGLELRARLAVEGFFTGLHRSPYRGLSIEFVDHRMYSQSDDFRHIDWKVFGRTDKYYIKEYEQETNLNCVVAVDTSASMTYRSEQAPMSKLDYAASIAAALAYVALQQRDAVGLALLEPSTPWVKPSNNPLQWKNLITELETQVGRSAGRRRPPAGTPRTPLRAHLDVLAERLQRRTLVVVLSDLLDDPEQTALGLKRLRYHKHEVIVFNVWDPAEVHFPFRGPSLFEDLESPDEVLLEPQLLRGEYLRAWERFVTTMRRHCRSMLIDYVPCETSMALDGAVSAYLATRSTSVRRRSSRAFGGGR